ncbi:MAG TPA: radical SAM protein [Pyrinomonadaceae bacterium]
MSDGKPVALVQLPFPSQGDPEPALCSYYSLYEHLYRQILPSYETSAGDLWEAPLWVAHLDGALGRDDTTFIDLSLESADPYACCAQIERRLSAPANVLMSPLAQNFHLAVETSRLLRQSGHVTVLGGNMARLAKPTDFDVVFIGQADAGLYEQIQNHGAGIAGAWPQLGKREKARGFRPSYRLLRGFAERVSLIRLNASHGCLFGCTFCGDGWSRQLQVVPYEDLEREFDEIEDTFSSINIVYVGDKTFGQSPEAVENLIRVSQKRRRRYRFIVQTHVSMINDWLLDALDRLGAEVVEMGFETADEQLLKAVHKYGNAASYRTALERLQSRGKSVILNVLGGLPFQTEETHAATLNFLRETSDVTYLYNLYNFVPYPETPLFASLKARIVDWDFSHWREDMPVVFEPYTLTRERSWEMFLELVRECENLCAKRARSLSTYADIIHA